MPFSIIRTLFACLIMAIATVGRYGIHSLKIDKRALLGCAALGIICHFENGAGKIFVCVDSNCHCISFVLYGCTENQGNQQSACDSIH